MARILLDTDILVDHLRGDLRFDPRDDDLHVSTITRAELSRAADDARVGRLLGAMKELPIDAAVAERAGRIRRATGARLAAAFIAATALEHELTLVTRNLWDFRGIDGLEAMSPEAR